MFSYIQAFNLCGGFA